MVKIAECMVKNKDYLTDFVVHEFTEKEIKEIVAELDTTNPEYVRCINFECSRILYFW